LAKKEKYCDEISQFRRESPNFDGIRVIDMRQFIFLAMQHALFI